MSQQAMPVVMCPGCGLAIKPTGTKSEPNELLKTTYHCRKCSAETVRITRKPPLASAPGQELLPARAASRGDRAPPSDESFTG